jgi:hypothetical protein
VAVTIFVWDMFQYRSGDGLGVGHASMFVHGDKGNIYISFWPSAHTLKAGWSSSGVVHFINGDKKADGQPSWASKSIYTLDEGAIIAWWSKIQHNPLIDYAHKGPVQVSGSGPASPGNTYSILFNQCSTTVVRALMIGANEDCRAKISRWLLANVGGTPFHVRVPTVTPEDVRGLVEAVF